MNKRRPGEVRDAIFAVLSDRPDGVSASEITTEVTRLIGHVAPSSVRSYLRLNASDSFKRNGRGHYSFRHLEVRESAPAPYIQGIETDFPVFSVGKSSLFHGDCFDWLRHQEHNSIHAVVTDPPYGLVEYSPVQQQKLRVGQGGVWRIPPSFDGAKRSPLPRFTVLKPEDLRALEEFFFNFGVALFPVLVPGSNVVVASNPLVSYIVSGALSKAGFERRGEIARLVMTMRGGDRPKHAHEEFPGVSVMPRSKWEPWVMFRKPLDGRVQDNLRRWKTGGFRRPSATQPFADVIASTPTGKSERQLASHPSLKPQDFLRSLVRGVLPLGEGVILDPFAGSGSTLAAAESVGYASIGVEKDPVYFDMAREAIPQLAAYRNGRNYSFDL